jgi:hypothetical protein
MELGFDAPAALTGRSGGERRLKRAEWWFRQMHRVVHEALDWRPVAPARPEQRWLPRLTRETPLG